MTDAADRTTGAAGGGSGFPRLVYALQQVFRPDRPYAALERLLLLYLVHKMGFDPVTQTHSCYFGAARIAADTGISLRTVRRLVERHRDSTHPLIAFSSRGHRRSLLSTLIRDQEAFVAARERARQASAGVHDARVGRKGRRRFLAAVAKLPARPPLALPARPADRAPRAARPPVLALECRCGRTILMVEGAAHEYDARSGCAGAAHTCPANECQADTLIQAAR